MMNGVVALAVVACTTRLITTLGAVPALADQRDRTGYCHQSIFPDRSKPGPIRTGPTDDSPIRGYCAPDLDHTIKVRWADSGSQRADYEWFLINDFDDPSGNGGGYINRSYVDTDEVSLRQCAPNEQWSN
jgi:hypothetical protein